MQRPGSQHSPSATGGQAPPPGRWEHRARVLDTGRLCLPPPWDTLTSRDSSGCRTWGRGATGIQWVEATARGLPTETHTAPYVHGAQVGSPRHRRWTRGLEEGSNTPCEKGVSNLRGLPVRVSSWPATGTLCSLRAHTHTHRHTCSRVVMCICWIDSKVPRPLSRAAVCWQEPGCGAWPQGPCFSCEDAPLQTPKGASARHIGTHLGGTGAQWMQA